jgi:hypothetical protein
VTLSVRAAGRVCALACALPSIKATVQTRPKRMASIEFGLMTHSSFVALSEITPHRTLAGRPHGSASKQRACRPEARGDIRKRFHVLPHG